MTSYQLPADMSDAARASIRIDDEITVETDGGSYRAATVTAVGYDTATIAIRQGWGQPDDTATIPLNINR